MFKEKKEEAVHLKETCPLCHRPVGPSKGSMTAWLFQEGRCTCKIKVGGGGQPARNV